MSDKTIRWGILETGRIEGVLARGLTGATTGELRAAVGRAQASVDEFAKEFPGIEAFGSYEALLASAAVYIYPQTRRLVELVREGAVGPLRVIRASFGFAADFDPEGRLFNNRLGGGGIMDVGCYPMSMARLLAGAAAGKPFADPASVTGTAKLNEETGVDEYASAVAKFPGNLIAELATGVRLARENRLVLFGDEGTIVVDHPWIITRKGGDQTIRIHRKGEEPREHLQTGHVEFYFLHRDDPGIPVGEWVDALHEQAEVGRIRAFGGSNWTLERVEAANAYARQHGKREFAALSNNFSLAEMVDPVWPGCVSASDPESRAWLTERQMPVFAWSSQARGFFLGDAPNPDDPEQVRCWHSEDNFERRRRADELAADLGVDPIHIAAAYVLAQAFPTFALVGPRTVAELHSTLRSLRVTLSPEQCAWLNLDSDTKPAR